MVPVVYGLQQSSHLSDLSTVQGQHKQDPDLWSYIFLLKVKIPRAITESLLNPCAVHIISEVSPAEFFGISGTALVTHCSCSSMLPKGVPTPALPPILKTGVPKTYL